jgi:hypothetical protein
MLRHVAVFTWNDTATPAALDEIVAALLALPGQIPELRAYHLGPDAGLDDGAGWRAYQANPAHQAARALMRPIIASRAAVQYEWS